MSYEIPGLQITLIASQEIEERYVPVKMSTTADNTIEVATAGDLIVGILQVPVHKAEGGPVMINGVSFAVASAPVPSGTEVEVSGVGTIAAGNTTPIGITLNAATAAGDIISIKLY